MPSSEVIAAILQAGRQAAAQGQFERAISLFRRVQEGYPTAPERSVATMLLAQTLERRRYIASALNEYRRLVAEFPQSPQAVLARAKIADLERQLPVARPPGMQLLGMYVEPEGLASLDEREFNRVRQSGTNTVVVGIARNRTFSAGRAKGAPPEQSAAGVYFKTHWAPVLQDRLAAAVGAGHQQSLQIWAALSVRRMEWVDPALKWVDWRYDPGTRRLIRWTSCTRRYRITWWASSRTWRPRESMACCCSPIHHRRRTKGSVPTRCGDMSGRSGRRSIQECSG